MNKIKKKKINLTPEEFNAKLLELKSAEVPYKINKSGINIHCKTYRHDYCASLTGTVAYEPNPATISKEFHNTTGYHYLEQDASEENMHPYGYTVKKITEDKTRVYWDLVTASGHGEVKEYYAKKKLKVWSYDVNSSFGYAMLQPMPNTRVAPRYKDTVKEGEMGFYIQGFCTTEVGAPADIIFPLMESPFIDYIKKYYDIKKNAPKGSVERTEAKYKLNIPTGCIQRHNIFIRNAILHYANRYIKKYIDENTVYCNVDSIYSLVPRDDLPIGNEIGEFKLEHINEDFKFISRGIYQIGNEIHYQGINSALLEDIEAVDLTPDALDKLKYIFDFNKEQFIENEKA